MAGQLILLLCWCWYSYIYKQMKDNIASVQVQFMALDIRELLHINKKDDTVNI